MNDVTPVDLKVLGSEILSEAMELQKRVYFLEEENEAFRVLIKSMIDAGGETQFYKAWVEEAEYQLDWKYLND